MMSSLPGTHIPGYQDQASVARLTYRQLGLTDMKVFESEIIIELINGF